MKTLRILFALIVTLLLPMQSTLAATAGTGNCTATSSAATPVLTLPPGINPSNPAPTGAARTTPLDFTAFTADASMWMCDYFDIANQIQIKPMIDTLSVALFVLFLVVGLVRASGNTKEQLGIVIRGCVASIVIFTMTGSNGSQIRQIMHDGWVGTYDYSTFKARTVIQDSVVEASTAITEQIGGGLVGIAGAVTGGGIVKNLLVGALKGGGLAGASAATRAGLTETKNSLLTKVKTGAKQVESLQKYLSFMYYATIPYIFFFSLTVFISGLTVILSYTLLPIAAALYVGNNLTALRGIFASYLGAILIVLIMPFAHTMAIKIGYVQPMNAVSQAIKINNDKHHAYETQVANDTIQADKDLAIAIATGKAPLIDAAAAALRTQAAIASNAASAAIGNAQDLLIQVLMGVAFLIMGMAMGTTIMGFMANFVLRVVGSGGISARNAPNMPRIGMGGKSGGKKPGGDTGKTAGTPSGPSASSGGSGTGGTSGGTSGGPGGGGAGGTGSGTGGSGTQIGGNAPSANSGALAASSTGGTGASGGTRLGSGGGSLSQRPHTSGANASSWRSRAQGAGSQTKPSTGRTDNPANRGAATTPPGSAAAVSPQGAGRFGRASTAANSANTRSAETRQANVQASAQAQQQQARAAQQQQGTATAGATRQGRFNRPMSERGSDGQPPAKAAPQQGNAQPAKAQQTTQAPQRRRPRPSSDNT